MRTIAFLMMSFLMFRLQAQQTREDFKNLKIEVFTQSATALRLYDFKPLVCAFDEQRVAEKRLNARIAKQNGLIKGLNLDNLKIIKDEFENEKEALTKSFSCQFMALEYGIKYLPAVVLDSSDVIYGYEDLREVEKIWMAHHG